MFPAFLSPPFSLVRPACLPKRRLCSASRRAITASVTPPSPPIPSTPSSSALISSDSFLLSSRGYSISDRVILFDGVCNLCNNSLSLLLRLDSRQLFKFAPLQSPAGLALLRTHSLPTDLSTIVYIDAGTPYVRSDAVLRITSALGPPLAPPAFLAMYAIPRPARDWFYTNIVANNRYDWFGSTESCRLPDPGEEHRFLD